MIYCSCGDEAGIHQKSDFIMATAHKTCGYCSGYHAWVSVALPAETVEAGWNHTGGI